MGEDAVARVSTSKRQKIADAKCLEIKTLSYGTVEMPRKHLNFSGGYKDVYHGDGSVEEKGGRGGDGRGGEGAIHRKLITGQQQGIDCANNGEWIMTEGSGLMQK